MEDRVMQFLLG